MCRQETMWLRREKPSVLTACAFLVLETQLQFLGLNSLRFS